MKILNHHIRARILCLLMLLALAVNPIGASAQDHRGVLDRVDIEEHLGLEVDQSLTFTDHTGAEVTLGDYFDDEMPVILTLNYYNCPMLCSLQLNAMIDGLKSLGWRPGESYRIVTISINPNEGPLLAEGKREAYLEALDMGDNPDWSFLVGDEENITAIADEVGFRYEWVPDIEEYAHPAAIFLLSPQGKITRYLYGLEYRDFDLRMGIVEAGEGTVGTTLDRVILSCFHYDPSRSTYAPFAFGVVRIGGIITLLILGLGLGVLWFRERRALTAE